MLLSNENLYRLLKAEGWLRWMGKPTPYKDRNGKQIHVGDLVEFYFAPDPSSDDPAHGSYVYEACEGYTKMEDVVIYIDGEHYFTCRQYGFGGFAHLYAEHCVVVGSLADYFKTRMLE